MQSPTQCSAGPSSSFRPACYSLPLDFLVKDPVYNFDKTDSPESRTKYALLGSQYNTVALYGPNGSGKTTLLLSLCSDHDLIKRFPDAIWAFNAAEKVDTFLLQLSTFIKQFLPHFYTSFRHMAADHLKWEAAMVLLVEQLKTKRVLLVFDNVWNCREGVGMLMSHIITELPTETFANVLLCSGKRQLHHISNFVYVCEVPALEERGGVARQILLQNAYSEQSLIPSNVQLKQHQYEITEAVAICQGLPLFLVMVGRTISILMEEVADEWGSAQAWGIFSNILRRYETSIQERHADLFIARSMKAIECCLEVRRRTWPSNFFLSPEDIVESFSAVDRRMRIPRNIIGFFFRVHNEEAISMLDLVSSVIPLTRIVSNTEVVEIEVPKAIYKYSRLRSEKTIYSTAARWHENVVAYCGHSMIKNVRFAKDIHFHSVVNRLWNGARRTRYVRENFVRHLLACDNLSLVVKLVCDYRWFGNYNSKEDNRIFQYVLEDFRILLNYGGCASNSLVFGEQGGSNFTDFDILFAELQYIRDAILDCSSVCAETPEQRSFQLFGRLYGVNGNFGLARIVTKSIVSYATSSWIQPSIGMIPRAGNMLKRILPIGIYIQRVVCGPLYNEITVGGFHGQLMVIDNATGLKKHDLLGHEKCISGLEIHPVSKLIFSSSWDGSIRVWKGNQIAREFWPFREDDLRHKDVSCMTIIPVRNQIACASECGIIRLLDMSTGVAITDLHGLIGNVWDLQASTDGRKIVSGSGLSGCLVWHSTEQSFAQSECLTRDTRGEQRFMFSSFCEEGKVELLRADCDWEPLTIYSLSDSETNGITKVLKVPSMDRIESLASGQSRDTFLTASADGDIRVWASRRRRLHFVGADLEYSCLGSLDFHGNSVTSLAVSCDDQELYSGSEDGTVCVWAMPSRFFQSSTHNISSKQQEEDIGHYLLRNSSERTKAAWAWSFDEFRNHNIHAFAISQNGQTLLILHKNGDVHWWKQMEIMDEAIWQPQRGIVLCQELSSVFCCERVCAAVTNDGSCFAFATDSKLYFRSGRDGDCLASSSFIDGKSDIGAFHDNNFFFPESLSFGRQGLEMRLLLSGECSEYKVIIVWSVPDISQYTPEHFDVALVGELRTVLPAEIRRKDAMPVYMRRAGIGQRCTYGTEILSREGANERTIAVLEIDIKEYEFSPDFHDTGTIWVLTHSGDLYYMKCYKEGVGLAASEWLYGVSDRELSESIISPKTQPQWTSPYRFVQDYGI